MPAATSLRKRGLPVARSCDQGAKIAQFPLTLRRATD